MLTIVAIIVLLQTAYSDCVAAGFCIASSLLSLTLFVPEYFCSYPATQAGAGSVSYAAHSSHVMNVRWTVGDECLLSCGVRCDLFYIAMEHCKLGK